MRKTTGAQGSEEEKDQKPTSEATGESATKDVAKEDVVDEVPVGASKPEATEPETDPDGPENPEEVVEEEVVEETSPIQVSPPLPGPARATLDEVDPKVHVKKKKKMFRIILDEQDNSDKNNDQLVTDPSDGKQYLIKRGFEVDVPEGVVNNLRESVIDRLEYDANGEEVWRSIPRFAMRVIKELN